MTLLNINIQNIYLKYLNTSMAKLDKAQVAYSTTTGSSNAAKRMKSGAVYEEM
jgi:hypothetical protein